LIGSLLALPRQKGESEERRGVPINHLRWRGKKSNRLVARERKREREGERERERDGGGRGREDDNDDDDDDVASRR
jgi:hypothetical protein